jgi:hypothetical protein
MFKSMMVAHDEAERPRRRKDLLGCSIAHDYMDDDTQYSCGFVRVDMGSQPS